MGVLDAFLFFCLLATKIVPPDQPRASTYSRQSCGQTAPQPAATHWFENLDLDFTPRHSARRVVFTNQDLSNRPQFLSDEEPVGIFQTRAFFPTYVRRAIMRSRCARRGGFSGGELKRKHDLSLQRTTDRQWTICANLGKFAQVVTFAHPAQMIKHQPKEALLKPAFPISIFIGWESGRRSEKFPLASPVLGLSPASACSLPSFFTASLRLGVVFHAVARRAPIAPWPGQRACKVDARSWPVPDTALSGAGKYSSGCGRDVPQTPAPRLWLSPSP